MSNLQPLLDAIEASPEGPEVCAIFDFDGTIISGYSAIAFIREQLRRGDLSVRDFLELASAMTSFGLGNMGFSAMMTVTSQFLRGIEEETYVELGETLFREQIARLVYPESRALIEAHRARGHTLAIISSATPYQVDPAAADLGIENVLCTQLEVEDGVFTGNVLRPTCFGQGKVDAAVSLANEVGGRLANAFFYSDSTDDQLLLEQVGHPVALNPSDRLRTVARDRQWASASFGSRGRPTLGQFIRSVAATVSLVPTFAAGLPIYALTGSRRERHELLHLPVCGDGQRPDQPGPRRARRGEPVEPPPGGVRVQSPEQGRRGHRSEAPAPRHGRHRQAGNQARCPSSARCWRWAAW
jgi:putative phosphoserine phosphatase/1-acylglycerol-3-phosphate O-acyltransferase